MKRLDFYLSPDVPVHIGKEGGAMMFARRRLIGFAGLLALLMTLLLCFASFALAESDPVVFTIQVTPVKLTEPGPVTVSLRVSNSSKKDMVSPVTLYDPAGNVVASFGNKGSYTLAAEAFRTWEGKWNVTQAQLDAGKFAYTLRYSIEDDSGEIVDMTRSAEAKIEATGEKVTLSVTRTITPEVVRSGGQATVTYELYNSGNIDLTDIRVKENISRTAQTIKTLAAGQRHTLTFSARMGNADLKSNATITYKSKGSTRTITEKVDNAVIPLAKPNLKISLSSPSAGVNIGEAATLVVTFTNNGNVSYSNVKVTDEKKGEILTNLKIPAGKTVVKEKEFVLKEPTTFKVSASLPDNTGETKTLSAGELTIGVFDPEKTLLLTLNLTADQDTVPQIPADVRFTLTVTNNSNVKAEKINISHGDTPIYTIASLEPGANVVLTRDVRISQAGKFRFTASVKDALNNTVTFDSNTLQITYAQPTQAPTVVPVVTVAPPTLMSPVPADPVLGQARSALETVGTVLGILFGAALLLFLVSTVVRLVRKAKSNAAYDHLELGQRRDYTEPADEELEDIDARTEENYNAVEDEEDLTGEPVQVKKPAEDLPNPDDMPDWDGEGGYRVTRAPEPKEEAKGEEKVHDAIQELQDELTDKADAAAKEAEEAAEEAVEPARHRRSRRTQRTEDGE